MAKIVLLSCTKSKLDKPCPAKDMYSPSPMFQKTKAYGEALKPDKMFILSAKYGLLPMDKQIEPYDLTPFLVSQCQVLGHMGRFEILKGYYEL